MDLRVERTRRSIINAFLELRSKKDLEKITIKELSELAFINKATFYSHFQDIYDLSEQLEDETVTAVLDYITVTDELITNPRKAAEMISIGFRSREQLIHILFSGSREPFFTGKLERQIKTKLYNSRPEYQNNCKLDIILTYAIHGSFQTLFTYASKMEEQELFNLIVDINNQVTKIL